MELVKDQMISVPRAAMILQILVLCSKFFSIILILYLARMCFTATKTSSDKYGEIYIKRCFLFNFLLENAAKHLIFVVLFWELKHPTSIGCFSSCLIGIVIASVKGYVIKCNDIWDIFIWVPPVLSSRSEKLFKSYILLRE